MSYELNEVIEIGATPAETASIANGEGNAILTGAMNTEDFGSVMVIGIGTQILTTKSVYVDIKESVDEGSTYTDLGLDASHTASGTEDLTVVAEVRADELSSKCSYCVGKVWHDDTGGSRICGCVLLMGFPRRTSAISQPNTVT